MTKYLVFRNVGPGEGELEEWRFLEEVEARSADSAIRLALNNKNAEGEFVATPRRSFRPVTVKVETKTALRFS